MNEHDEKVASDDAARDAGWLGGEAAAQTSSAADDFFGVDPVAAGWNVEKTPAPEPAPPAPTLDDDRAAAAKLGLDRDAVAQYLSDNPGLEETMVSQGMLVAEPKTESELLRNLAAVEMLQNAETAAQTLRESQQQQALTLAVQAYEEGEADPVEIADLLLERVGPEAADAFTRHWEHEEGYGEDEWAEPLTPDEWRERARQKMAEDAAFEQFIQEAQVAQAAEAEQARLSAEVEAAGREFMQRVPDAERYGPQITSLIRQLDPRTINNAESAARALQAAYRGAKELERAEWAANILTEFDEDNAARSGYLEPQAQFDRQTAFTANLANTINPNAIRKKTLADFSQQLDDEFFGGRTKQIADEWGKLDQIDWRRRNPRRR